MSNQPIKRNNSELSPIQKEQVKQLKMGDKIDRILEEVLSVKSQLTTLEERCSNFMARCEKMEQAITTIQENCEVIDERINAIEQAALKNSFRITGVIKVLKGSDASIPTMKIMEKLGVTISKLEFKNLFIVPNRTGNESTIFGEFFDERKCIETMKAFKAYKRVKPLLYGDIASEVDAQAKAKEVRILPQLTSFNRSLMTAAHAKGNFKYVWFANGKVLVRANDGMKAMEIKSPTQLRNVSDNTTHS